MFPPYLWLSTSFQMTDEPQRMSDMYETESQTWENQPVDTLTFPFAVNSWYGTLRHTCICLDKQYACVHWNTIQHSSITTKWRAYLTMQVLWHGRYVKLFRKKYSQLISECRVYLANRSCLARSYTTFTSDSTFSVSSSLSFMSEVEAECSCERNVPQYYVLISNILLLIEFKHVSFFFKCVG
jgi:hypothetical protein